MLADTGRLPDGASCELDPVEHVLRFSCGDSWVSMQRIGGGRAVIWGRAAGSTRDAISEGLDVLDGAPDWASSNAVWGSIRNAKPGFLAWYSRDGWDTNTAGMFDGVITMLLPLLRADPHLVEAARTGEADSEMLAQARGVAHVATQGAVRKRLRQQIHAQMRETPERDRRLPDRPTLLARWARVNDPALDFVRVVLVDEGRLVTVSGTDRLPDSKVSSLYNVLLELHRAEAHEESGAWLAARVSYLGGRIQLDRAFDSLPAWYTGKGPTMRALSWEMQQREPRWRPAWATLLPDFS